MARPQNLADIPARGPTEEFGPTEELRGREVERDRPMKRAQAAGVCVCAISSAGAPVPPPPAFAELDMVAIGRKGGTGPLNAAAESECRYWNRESRLRYLSMCFGSFGPARRRYGAEYSGPASRGTCGAAWPPSARPPPLHTTPHWSTLWVPAQYPVQYPKGYL
jgi:hypothetical protein